MPLIDLAAIAAQCRISPQALVEVLEQIQDAFALTETFAFQQNVPGSSAMPAISTMEIENQDDHRAMKGLIFCSASAYVGVTSPAIVIGHSLFRDGVDLGSFGLWSGEPGWNTLFNSTDDKVLPPICHAVTINPGVTTEFVHTVDLHASFSTGTASSKAAESRTMIFLGGL